MTESLDGHLALVTGAGRGLGRGCAEGLANAGARVIAVARSIDDLDQVAGHESGRIEAWQADVTDDQLVERIEALPDLSILVNNAGGNRPQPFTEFSDQDLDFMLDLNVRSAFRVARGAARSMLNSKLSGSIIHMSSQMGHVGSPGRSAYCMTKHAIEGLTKAMAVELAPQGIRVNSVAPTFVDTPLTRPMLEDPVFNDFVHSMIPLGRLASIEDVVSGVVYLASPASGMITGHSLRIDGGWTAQ